MNNDKNKSINLKKIEDVKAPTIDEKIVLHACCAPCNLEPYRILSELGWNITVMYSNSNIFPESEFYKRAKELEKWCDNNDATLIIDNYNNNEWDKRVSVLGEHPAKTKKREIRCGECYQLRLEHAAVYAKDNNIKYLTSTLAVSPYQYNDVLEQKLNKVCKQYDLTPIFIDFRPFYRQATKRSQELRMYRQKYCGCEFSFKESWKQFEKSKNKKYLNELKSIRDSPHLTKSPHF